MAINSSIIDNPIISITNQINQYKIVLMFYNVKVFGDSSRLAFDLCVGRLFRQTRVIASTVIEN